MNTLRRDLNPYLVELGVKRGADDAFGDEYAEIHTRRAAQRRATGAAATTAAGVHYNSMDVDVERAAEIQAAVVAQYNSIDDVFDGLNLLDETVEYHMQQDGAWDHKKYTDWLEEYDTRLRAVVSIIATFNAISRDSVGNAFTGFVNVIADTAISISRQALCGYTNTSQVRSNLAELRVKIHHLHSWMTHMTA